VVFMANRELKRIVEKGMVSGEYKIAFAGASEQQAGGKLAMLFSQLGALAESNLPFCYSRVGKNVLIADHVTFSSQKTLTRQIESLMDLFASRRDLTLQKKSLTGRFKKLPPISKGSNTARNYLANCALAFGEHYDRLPGYKDMLEREGIIKPGCNVKTCFFIEDSTPLGSYILSSDGMHELALPYVKQFLDLFERSADLDYVFLGCFTGCSNALWFIGREDIGLYRKKEMDLLRRMYFSFDVRKDS
jgi:hypothetical protein